MYLLTGADEYRFPGSEPPYVLDLIPLASGLATITTDGKLSLFDPLRIGAGPKRSFATQHGNLRTARALDPAGCVLATAGENGSVAIWDLRDSAQGAQASHQVGTNRPYRLPGFPRIQQLTTRLMRCQRDGAGV